MFPKKGVIRSFAKFTGKHLRQSLLFNKVAGNRNNFSYRTPLVAYSDISTFLMQDLKNFLSLEDDKEDT